MAAAVGPGGLARSATPVTGRWLDAGTWPGFSVFCRAERGDLGRCLVSVCSCAVSSAAALARLGLHAAAVLHRARGAAPADLASRPRALLADLALRLRRAPGVKVVAWARIPEGRANADELRLLVHVAGALRGLLGVEVGVEYGAAVGGCAAAPFVLIRAREGSPVVNALPRELIWTRGRKADERAALLRPRLPTRAHCQRLLLELVSQLRDREQTPNQRSRPARNTSQTLVARGVQSPAHVL